VIFDPLRRSRGPAAPFDELRKRLVAEIVAEVRETSRYLGKVELDPRVVAALAKVPREDFVPEAERRLAYDNAPLAIGHGQTISQPYIVAIMTDMLEPRSDDVVLEVGTGSGYQAAVLAELVARVYTIEYVVELAAAAQERLARLGYANVEVRTGDGWAGWPEHAPYDGIIVTAAAPVVPAALVAQLKPGRRLVVPVGEPGSYQELKIVEKNAAGEVTERATLPVAFVPLLGGS
jgi:protein-L-isoaspartate(D-aspartate) O-methyltransferase